MPEKPNPNSSEHEISYARRVLGGVQMVLEAVRSARRTTLRRQAEMIGYVVFSSDEQTTDVAISAAHRQFAGQLRALQTDSGISQKEIAREIHTQQSTVSDALSGRMAPTIATYLKLVNALGGTLQIVYTPPDALDLGADRSIDGLRQLDTGGEVG